MKKIILLLLSFFIMGKVEAYDLIEAFYYNDEKVENMWITKVKGNEIASGVPFILKRVSDDAYVYCLQPFSLLKMEENYQGYYDIVDKFSLTEEKLERIRLLSHFGYKYLGHNDIKWYGITQYLIWKTVDEDADIYFTDTRYGNRIDIYISEIAEIEYLISEYLELLKYNNQKMIFTDIEEFYNWRDSNIFLKDINISSNQIIEIPINSTNEKEVFYYHEKGQNVYLQKKISINNISLGIEFVKEIIIRKWYGSGKYDLEEGATFEIYKDNKLVDTIVTDKYGIAHITLPYGNYNIIQVSGIEGYNFIDPFEINVGINRLNELIELYNEAKKIEVPNTSKNIPGLLFIMPLIFFFIKIKH